MILSRLRVWRGRLFRIKCQITTGYETSLRTNYNSDGMAKTSNLRHHTLRLSTVLQLS